MGKSRSVPYTPITPATYDPYAGQKEAARRRREHEDYLIDLEYDRRREEENNREHSLDGLEIDSDYGPDHADWGKY